MSKKLDNVIRMNPEVPPLGSKEFKKWLKDWHAKNNNTGARLTPKGNAKVKEIRGN